MIANHLWQSTLFALAVMLIALLLRKNRAAVRHRLWLIASIKFLMPFALFTAIGSQFHWQKAPTRLAEPISTAIVRLNEPFPVTESFLIPSQAQTIAKQGRTVTVLFALWLFGFLVSLGLWFRQWIRLRRAAKKATRLDVAFPIPVLSCRETIEPGVFGVLHPVLLLPDGIQARLSREHLQAVLAHEMSHVRRRDNLASAIHMIVESLFWFHPLVWWIRARLIEEQERACDEEVLRQGSDPRIYAESILKICEFHFAPPLPCVSGIAGADLKERIASIMRNHAALRLGWRGATLLACASAMAIAVPLLVGVLRASSEWSQQRPREEFEAASIRLTDPDAPPPPGVRGGGGGPCSSSGMQLDPSHLTISNTTLYGLIAMTYGENSCMRWAKYGMLSGGPDWIRKDKFTIQAVMPEGFPKYTRKQFNEGEAPRLQSMLQSLLEDRFKLKFHHATKEVSLYELVAAREGVKLNWNGQNTSEGIRLMKPEDCDEVDPLSALESGIPATKPFCGSRMLTFAGSPPRSWLLTMTGATTGQLASMLEISLDRPIVDKSGISGKINLRVTFAFDETTPIPSGGPANMTFDPDPGAPTLFTALQEKLGLRLTATRGAVDIIVIDRVERPTN